jgi:hypothetical protein
MEAKYTKNKIPFTAHPKARLTGQPFTGKNCDQTGFFGVLQATPLTILNSPIRLPPINFRSPLRQPSFASK